MAVSAATLVALYNSRFCFGAKSGDTTAPTTTTLNSWLTKQLAVTADPADIKTRLTTTPVLYPPYTTASGASVRETATPATLWLTDAQLWARLQANPHDSTRAFAEVNHAYFVRTINSSAQLWETMTDFWHNHFSIDASLAEVRVYLPYYDQAIRVNALGNFRTMLGATAKSMCMMNYLNLVASTKTAPNENYARELMEIHTLGIDAYLGATTPTGQANVGYSDSDVTQAARVLTGWTMVNGTFTFNAGWHDTGTKTLLGITVSNNGVTEGETLLQRLATHPATALHIAKKLYVKFISDVIPANSTLIPQLTSLFLATTNSSTQIAQLIAAIAASDEFASSTGAKLKTPTELVPSWYRAVGTDLCTNAYGSLNQVYTQLGAPLFSWPTANGMPDIATGWLSTSGLMNRWNYPETFFAPNPSLNTGGGWLAQGPLNNDPAQVPAFVKSVLQSMSPSASTASLGALTAFAQLPTVLGNKATLTNATSRAASVAAVVAAALALPEFQIR